MRASRVTKAKSKKTPEIGSRIADVTGDTQLGKLRLRDYFDGSWGVIVSFPTALHPVWITEVGALTKLKKEFDARNCRLLAIHKETVKNQDDFIAHVNETQDVLVNFPIFADPSGDAMKKLGVAGVPETDDDGPVTAASEKQMQWNRSSVMYIVDIDCTIRMIWRYPTMVGRNFYELIRALDALQLALYNQVVTPTNWKINDDVFIEPDITNEAAAGLFPQGFHEIKPYFRITPSPAVLNEDA